MQYDQCICAPGFVRNDEDKCVKVDECVNVCYMPDGTVSIYSCPASNIRIKNMRNIFILYQSSTPGEMAQMESFPVEGKDLFILCDQTTTADALAAKGAKIPGAPFTNMVEL